MRNHRHFHKHSTLSDDAKVTPTPSSWFARLFPIVVAKRDLEPEQMREVVSQLVQGSADEIESAVFLTAMRMKGETAIELAAAASVLREHMLCLDAGNVPVLDTCGTGGDGSGSFNISTAVAFVVAGAGVKVVKHGNRAVSSRSGSADVLTELGVPINATPVQAQSMLDHVGFAFCFAPQFHPAVANIAKVRRRLGIRTLFNLIGPLANPARAPYQLLGVGVPESLDPLAGALALLGIRQAYLVSGTDGFDEVSLAAPTRVRWVRNGVVESLEWTVDDFGLEPVAIAELRAEGPKESAEIIRHILNGKPGGPRRIVIANAAAGFLAAEKVTNLRDGVALAEQSIDSGAAKRVLESLIARNGEDAP